MAGSLGGFQKPGGKIGSEAYGRWLTKKRTANVAGYIADVLAEMDFVEFEFLLCFRCDDSRMGYFLKVYGGQLEDAVLNPGKFKRGLDGFLLDTCIYVRENNLFRDYFDFFMLLEKQHAGSQYGDSAKVFSAYVSLLMQQTSYFCMDAPDRNVTGVEKDGSLILGKQLFPYSDVASYELEEKINGGNPSTLSSRDFREAFGLYGYDVSSLEQAMLFECVVRQHENNVFFMAPFIDGRTASLVLEKPFYGGMQDLPRQWKKTEVYKERLLDRNYMLPRTGVVAVYRNAGSINRIIFFETIQFDEVVLLFKVITDSGEYSGFYWTKSQLFFSGCGDACLADVTDSLENFILENYMVLTCDYTIDRKRNFSLKQTDGDGLAWEFYYPDQPLVYYCYKKSEGKGKSKSYRYVKEEYSEELRTMSGYVRRLPEGQHASEEAVQAARELGLSLPEGRTFVRSHDYHVYVKTVNKR